MPVTALKMTRVLASSALLCGLLIGCDEAPAPEPEQTAGAEDVGEEAPVAEILEGSVSDSMIELDGLRSQPPLGAGEDDASGEDEDEASPAE